MRVCVIGGGASGMMCATMIARKGHSVELFEKNEKLGKKMYITGKGRCNVSNATSDREFLSNVVHGQKFVMGAITRFDYNDTIDFFNEMHVPLKIERGNRIFPESDKSSDIISALEKAMKWAGVHVHLNSKVDDIVIDNDIVKGIIVNGNEIDFDAVIIATGGLSYPLTGSTGDGYKFAEKLGHTIVDTVPALCAIKVKEKNIAKLSNLALKNVKLFAKTSQKVLFESEIGELTFLDDEITGPLVLTCSSYINREDFSDLKLVIDLKPALSMETLEYRIDRDIIDIKAGSVLELLERLLPKQLTSVVAERLEINIDEKANQLNKDRRKRLAFLLKNFEILPEKLDKIDNAIVTSGGVNLKEINPKFMKSKLVSNVYFIGEVLDIDALTGGFNIQLAFSTAVTCANDFRDYR